jgi:hypothetical protein
MRSLLALVILLVARVVIAADEPIPWEEADKHVGEDATVEGRVVDIHCSPLSCLLAFEPSFNRFTAVVQAKSFGALPPDDLKARFHGKVVRVHGRITSRDSKPEISVETPDQIALATGTPKPRAASERTQDAARAESDTMERMADVLERVADLTERMAAVQERMETLLAQMEQRDAALAAAQAPPPAPETAQRPAYETLRSLKRGMSRGDVERLVGTPEYVENGGQGWTTWYYGGGRSVSFDGRGRVQAFVGFASP